MKVVSATEFTISEMTDLFRLGFENYVIDVDINKKLFSYFCRIFSLDLSLSKIILKENRPVAFLLIGSQGSTIRGSAMGVVKEFRRQGYGTRLMLATIEEIRRMGYKRFTLEVIKENIAAFDLYQKCGFKVTDRLVGYEITPKKLNHGHKSDRLIAIDTVQVANKIASEDTRRMPWQCTCYYFAGLVFPSRGVALSDKAYAIITPRDDGNIGINALFVPEEHRNQGWGRRMLSTLADIYPNRTFCINPIIPENFFSGFFQRVGFEKSELSQYEMMIEFQNDIP